MEYAIGFLLLTGLYLTSLYNYVLFHFLAEFFSIIVAFGVFLLAWNSRRFVDNYYLLLGIAYLFVAALDLCHALAYKGMGVFLNDDPNLPTQLWIVARYFESITLLIAPVFIISKKTTRLKKFQLLSLGYRIFLVYLTIFIAVVIAIFWLEIFPICYVEGVGLTLFKIASEYLISLILLGALFHIYQHRRFFAPQMFQWLVLSIIFSIATEMAFTLYIDVYGIMNLLGHYFKLVSYYFLYKAMIETSLVHPYESLFRKLKASERRFRSYFEQPLIGIAILSPQDKKWVEVNNKLCEILDYTRNTLVEKQTWISVTHPDDWLNEQVKLNELKSGKLENYSIEKRFLRRDGIVIDTSVSLQCVRNENQNSEYFIAVVADITERKHVERDRENLIVELKEALSDIRILQGLLPICPSCRKVKDNQGYWRLVEDYISRHSDVEFQYTICDNCLKNKYPTAYEAKKVAQQYGIYLNKAIHQKSLEK